MRKAGPGQRPVQPCAQSGKSPGGVGQNPWPFPCQSSCHQAPTQRLQQGACLKEAQLYLSGWRVHSRGRAAWGPRHRTSSLSAQGPSSVPGPSGGRLLHPEIRSSHCNTCTSCIPQTSPAQPISPKSTRATGSVPGPGPAVSRLGHLEEDKFSVYRTFRVTKMGSEESALILEMGKKQIRAPIPEAKDSVPELSKEAHRAGSLGWQPHRRDHSQHF